jgi:DNA-binding response OmpR family regulator
MKKILLIEDNYEMRENISELLELSGFEVSNAENGKKGVHLALTYLPDLIICDIMMPEMDGYEVLHLLSRNPKSSHIPFLFLSAKSEAKDLRKGMNLGADDYLTKPFEELDLLNAVEARFKRNEQLKGMENSSGGAQSLESLIENANERNYKAKSVIYSEQDHFRFIYYVVKGKVRIYKSHEAGKEFTTKLFGAGDWFGLSGAFEKPYYDHGAQAMENTDLKLIDSEPFFEALFHSKSLVKKVLTEVLEEKGENERKLVELAYNSVRRRVADALIELYEKYYDKENKNQIKIPRDALASIAGTSTESAIRMLSEFKDSGFISINKMGIEILELDKLKNAPY